ncbi:tensin-1-like isoform X3 [Argiope bruennichi]|uniref:tensin-1-like isoform X3 n=1 Tax=Argiope bruennichi TaxID=94029 RepID=UPI0024949A01|nr:tensin-1-like isoform X3 [Argiope bruennichi]
MLALCWCKSSPATKRRFLCRTEESRHDFRTKTFRKDRFCDVCQRPIDYQGSSCKSCKVACHKECEMKVVAGCEPSSVNYELRSPSLVKGPDKIRRSRSLDRHPTFAMDITYVTERIIVITFPQTETDATYKSNLKEVTRMLRTKHGTNYMVFNLSEKRYDLAKFNNRVFEFGWPPNLAPPLERLCSICKSVDSWLNSDPQNIAVIHSKGDKGRAGVVIAAYMHYSNICASADQALDRFAMKQFFDDKLADSMQPSQKRYVHYFAGLLSGAIRMNNNSLFLHRIIIHGVPNFDSRGGCRPFVKIYQGMQQIYTSGVYSATEKSRKIIISLDAGLQVRGDVFIKCYHKSSRPLARYTIFQLQFHTCTIDSNEVTFEKGELDNACTDSRFTANGKVELLFSSHREDFRGNGSVQDSTMPVESSNDPLVKWDSYENFDLVPEDNLDVLYTEGPLDGSLYATVTKKKYTDVLIHPHLNQDSFNDVEGPHSIDSGISSSSGIRNVDIESHNPSERSTSRTTPYSNFKDEQAELDELVHGMLKEIQSIPDAPVYSTLRPFTSSLSSPSPKNQNFSSITTTTIETENYATPRSTSVPTSIISVNGNKQVFSGSNYKPIESVTYSQKREVFFDDEENTPYHARKSASPFTYSAQSPVGERKRLLSDGHQPLGTSERYRDGPSFSWLQRQQDKLKARKEGRGWDDRHQKEQLLLDELRRTQKKPLANGESFEDISLGLDFSSSSRETSPSKGLSYTLPLHVHTYNGHTSTSQTQPTKPPVYRNTSAPSSPILPQRSSSKDVTRYRYPQFQSQSKTLTRQNSDTSYDRERPFVATRKAHQLAKEQIASNRTSPHNVIASSTIYGNVYSPKPDFSDPGLLGLANSGNKQNTTPDPSAAKLDKLERTLQELSVSSSSTNSPRDARGSPLPYQSTPNKGSYTIDGSSWSPSVIGSSPPSSPSRMDRPVTPAFPVPPGTPYQNQDPTCSTLPPKSPLLSRFSQSYRLAMRDTYNKMNSRRWSCLIESDWTKDRSPSPATLQNMHHDFSAMQRPSSTNGQSSPSVYYGQSRPSSMVSLNESSEVIHHHPMFVKDTSKYWYKPNISREEAINILKDKAPGTFIIRDSNSFPGAYGLALKVATPPPNVPINKSGDPSNELVRHFLIETTSKGVRLKGCQNEPTFGSLSALVYQHSITPLALPCRLVLPEQDLMPDADEQAKNNDSLLEQGAACTVLYLTSVEMESLTGPQAVKKAVTEALAKKPLPSAVPVHFKVSNQGITLTDNTRKLFFRRHYPVKSISHCGLDLEGRKWTQTNEDGVPINTCRIFGFVARKPTSQTDNQCHLFAEHDADQPASAIVHFVTKVMMTETPQTSQMV